MSNYCFSVLVVMGRTAVEFVPYWQQEIEDTTAATLENPMVEYMEESVQQTVKKEE